MFVHAKKISKDILAIRPRWMIMSFTGWSSGLERIFNDQFNMHLESGLEK